MAVQWSAPELATRYSSHVEELRDFFALQRLHFGSADDIAPLVARIDASESFREDLTSMVRSIILHEGGTIPRANLLEIVAFAIGGRDMDQAGLEVQEPLRQLLSFLIGVQRKPWNQPPGESRLQLAPLPNVVRSVAETPLRYKAAGSDAGPAAGKVIPITAREATPPVIPAPAEPDAQPVVKPFARPDEIYSRFTRLETQAAPEAESASEPQSIALAAQPEPDPDTVADAAVSAAATETEPEPMPEAPVASGIPSPMPEPAPPPPPPPFTAISPPVPAATFATSAAPSLLQRHPAMPPSALDPEPPSPSLHAAMHLPFELPSFAIPDLPLPQIALPASPRARARMAVFTAGGAVLLIAVLVLAARAHSPAVVQVSAVPVTPAPPAESAAVTPTAAAPPAKPSAYGPAIAQPAGHTPRQSTRDDGYIAKPYSSSPANPAPAQSAQAPAPIVRVSPGQTAAVASAPQYSSNTAHPVALQTSAQPAPRAPARPINPDATFVGEGSPAEESIPLPRRPASVASTIMAANLISAPQPGYPMLAKVAHIQGKVVLRAEVDRNGTVTDVEVLSGHHLLRGAATEAVRHWRYRPFLVDGRPAPVFTTITLNIPSHASK